MTFECDAKAIPSWVQIEAPIIHTTNVSYSQHQLITHLTATLRFSVLLCSLVLWAKCSQSHLELLAKS